MAAQARRAVENACLYLCRIMPELLRGMYATTGLMSGVYGGAEVSIGVENHLTRK
ncbi:hypothetical protein APS_0701 [Acetobacter pasteurianus subsp. pasteurianus LMG 1262 = NBRC 106471]|nr:hypothetical protein APS_0701 [Acetobacter pasteurianus subsp. pasteurianus LMG 1262 = NBRC 106471]